MERLVESFFRLLGFGQIPDDPHIPDHSPGAIPQRSNVQIHGVVATVLAAVQALSLPAPVFENPCPNLIAKFLGIVGRQNDILEVLSKDFFFGPADGPKVCLIHERNTSLEIARGDEFVGAVHDVSQPPRPLFFSFVRSDIPRDSGGADNLSVGVLDR